MPCPQGQSGQVLKISLISNVKTGRFAVKRMEDYEMFCYYNLCYYS
jgi:hypothetical protein